MSLDAILMYHSISDGAGPLCIDPDTFRRHLDLIVNLDRPVLTLGETLESPRRDGPVGRIVLTFDDGYRDFATQAFPLLQERKLRATVFLPTGFIGREARGAGPLDSYLDWDVVAELAQAGIELGSHAVEHEDLTALTDAHLESVLERSREHIAARMGVAPRCFAPPYGRTDPRVRAAVARWYAMAAGTRLGLAGSDADPYDLPRLEMGYFREPDRLRLLLERGSSGYFELRRFLRAMRHRVTGG